MMIALGTDEILGAILPEELIDGAPSGFSATGHIGACHITVLRPRVSITSAHFNLNDEYLPYKHIIGQVILDVCATSAFPCLRF